MVSKVHFSKQRALKIEIIKLYGSIGQWTFYVVYLNMEPGQCSSYGLERAILSRGTCKLSWSCGLLNSLWAKYDWIFWTMSSSQTSALTQEPEESTVAASVPDMSNTESTELAAIPKVKHAPFQSLPTLRGEITEEQLKDPGEIFRKEQAKKYFSLRVRAL